MDLRKMWVAVGATVATLLYSLLADGGMTGDDWAVFLTQGGGIVLVWYVKNTDDAWYAKAIAAAWTGGTVVFMVVFSNGVSGDEWGQIGIAALNAILVLVVGRTPVTNIPGGERVPPPAAA